MLKDQFIQKKSNHQRQKDRKGKSSFYAIILIYLFLSGTLLQVLPALAASPTPGTVIDNQATGTFIDSTDNSQKQVESNTVTVIVAEVTGITITPANTPSATAGGTTNFDFTITNVGNDPTQFFIPDAPSTISGGTAGTLQIVAYDPDGSGPTAAVDLTGNNVTVPGGGGNTGTLLSAIASANNGSIPANASIVVRVPVTVTAAGGQTVSVALGNTGGQPSNINTPYVVGANGSGSKDLYTVDNADGISGESAGVPINGDATNHRQEASAIQTATVFNTVSGTIYRDSDRSGTNNSEPGIGSIRVILYKDNDNNDEVDSTSEIIQQVNTLADGTYQFTNVPAGTYKIKVDIADTDVPVGYTLGTPDNLPVTVNTTNITGRDFGFYPALTCQWDAQLYTGHFPVAGTGANDTGAVGYYGPTGLPTLRGTAKFGAGIAKFTFNDQTISVNPPVHPLRTIINGSFPSQGYVPINGDYPLRTYANTGDDPNWVIVFKQQVLTKGRITLGQPGAYIDDDMEIYVNGVRVGNPIVSYTNNLPANKVSTVSVNAGDIVEIRLTNNGAIGGFVVSTDFVYDFGDAPASYGEASQAPSCSNPRLGATATGESSQAYNATASGDAGDDGVTLPGNLTPGTTATIIVNASAAGFLNSWIDFNQNGVFDSGEQLNITNVTKGTAATVNNVPLNAGNNTLTFPVPSNATAGSSFARFRYTTSTVATPSPTGSGDAGEVEDYQVAIANPVNISGTVFSDADADVTINGSDTATNAGSGLLTIYAIDTAGKVLDKASVAANGTYSLTNVPPNAPVTLRLSNDNSVAIGATAPTTPSIPSGWYNTGENLNGTIDPVIATLGDIALITTTANLTNENFGIRQAYTITPDAAPTTCNPDYRTALNTGVTTGGGQLATGSNDLNWTAEWIAGPASGPGTPYAPPRPVGPMPAAVIGNLAPGAWVNEPANARWISYPFRLSGNGNGVHNDADLDGINGEGNSGFSGPGTSDDVRLKFTSQVTLPSNANTIAISLPVGVAVDNQFVSIKVNGVENLVPTPAPNSQAAEYGSLKSVNITNGWQAGVNTIEVTVDSGPDRVGFFLGVQASSIQVCTKANVLFVKRITAINGDRAKNPNDNTSLNTFVDDTTSTRQADDNSPNWKANYLLGAIDAGIVKPGDEIEYTIYFLNAGSAKADSVRVCDRITANQDFKVGAYGTNKDVQLQLGTSTVIDLTSASDAGDRTQLISAGATVPTNCYLKAANDNGTLVVDVTGNTGVPNLTTMPGSTAQGSPNDSYGFFRFVTKVKP